MQSDFLIIGGGIAGLSIALDLAPHGSVTIVTKDTAFESNSQYAQGGIAAAFGADDNPELHIHDTLIAGAGLCHRDAVEQIVREGPNAVRRLQQRGVAFTMRHDAEYDLGREGGHSRNRIVHATDITGREIIHALIDDVRRERRITLREYHTAIELLIDANTARCAGAWMLERQSGEMIPFFADVTILCNGGAGQVFLHTTNPPVATGDGIALAYRAGAAIANMEFFQFHPTMLAHPAAHSFLISEAVRGFGAELESADGTRFMEQVHPLRSLAPRDIVARAIHHEMIARNEDCVYLDLRTRNAKEIRDRFPHIYAECQALGIDMARDRIPVVPAAHYLCGGIETDLQARTTIAGLFACGETACTGAHGANRLASNSLLEAMVFARRAANAAVEEQQTLRHKNHLSISPIDQSARTGSFETQTALREKIRRVMWDDAGIVRTNAGLARAAQTLDAIALDVDDATRDTHTTTASSELKNILLVARLIVRSAQLRGESRGTHFNADIPAGDDAHWLRDTVLRSEQFSGTISRENISTS